MRRSSRITIVLLLQFFTVLFAPTLSWGQWHIPVISGITPNSATSLGNDCFRITPGANSLGVVWDSTRIDLAQPFDITLDINQAPWGADGLALVLQNVGLNAYGAGANALGFGNSIPASAGYPPIVNSVAFEIDTWDNSGAGVNDIAQDHVAIHVNGDMTTTLGLPVSALAAGTDITDGLCHQLRVTWNPATTQMRIYFDANPVPRITRVYDMINLAFGGNPLVWWGITGSSGGSGMTQTVCVGRNFTQAGLDRYACAADTLHLQATGASAFTWTGPGFLSANNIPNPVFGPAPAGNYAYRVSATNAALCTDIDSVVVQIDAVPVANPGLVGNICLGDSALLGVAGNPAYSYLWQPNTYLSNPNLARPWLKPALAGPLNYSLIVTNISGVSACADTALLTVIARDTPTVSLAASNPSICLGQSTNLTAITNGGTPGYTYAWNNGPISSAQTVSPGSTATYSVVVTDAQTCTTAGNITVTVAAVPTANPGIVGNICLGDSVLLGTVGNPNFAYLWQPAAQLRNPDQAQTWCLPLTAGPTVYALIVTDTTNSLACADTANLSFVVRDTPTVALLAVNDSICQGETSILSAQAANGTAPYAFVWSNGPLTSSQSVTPAVSSPYSVQVTDALNCQAIGSLTVVVNDTPQVSLAASPDSICAGQSTTLIATATFGSPGYNFTWNASAATTAIVAIAPLASTNVTVTVTDARGCKSSDILMITVNVTDSIALLQPDTLVCLGGSVQVAGTFATAGINSWQWTPVAGVGNPNIPNPTLMPTVATTYYLSGLNTLTGCGFTDSIVVGYVPLGPPLVILGPDTILCAGQVSTLLAGNPGFQYLWSDGSTGPSYVVNATGWVGLSVVDTFGCGYQAHDSVYWEIVPLPAPDLGADTTICPYDSLFLDAGVVATNYLWSTGATSVGIWTTVPGTYFLQVVDSNGCSGADTMVLSQTAIVPVAIMGLDSAYCSSDAAVQLVGSPPGGQFLGPVSGNGLFTPALAQSGAATIRYTWTDSFGCPQLIDAPTYVALPPGPAIAGSYQVVDDLVQLAAFVPTVGAGTWSATGLSASLFSDVHAPNATVSGLPSGSYNLYWTVTNAPCPAVSDSLRILVEGLSVPTGFSPDGDGVNDYYVLKGLGGNPDVHLSIFNRWGNLVWESAHYQNEWNGQNLNAQPLSEDTYYAILEFGGKSLNTYIVLKRD